MSEVLILHHLSLIPNGATLSLVVSAGQSLTIVGPSRSGKTSLLRLLAGQGRPQEGYVSIQGSVAFATAFASRKPKVGSLAKFQGHQGRSSRITELLLATRLWDRRTDSLADLSDSELAAAELLGPLSQDSNLLLIDGQLDRLDPWVFRSVMAVLGEKMNQGTAVVAVTNRPDVIKELGTLVVLSDYAIKFAGSVVDLLRHGPNHEVTVKTKNQPGVRALVEPFRVSVQPCEDGIRFFAPEGQDLVAHLLREGYGDIEFITLKQPTIEEALSRLI